MGTARKNSDTEKLCNLVFEDAAFDLIDLLDYPIAHYDYEEHYPENDRFMEIAEKMLAYDSIIFATPVYWYAMSSYLKVFFDRITDLTRTHRTIGHQLAGKTMFMLTTSASKEIPEGFEIPFSETAGYLKMEYGGAYFTPSFQFDQPYPGKEAFAEKVMDSLKEESLTV